MGQTVQKAKSHYLPILYGHVRVNDLVHSLSAVRVAVSVSIPALVLPSQVYSPARDVSTVVNSNVRV